MRVSQALSVINRYKNDEEYRQKQLDMTKKYNHMEKNKIKRKQKKVNYINKLNIYNNKHCTVCGKLLYFTTKGDVCRECRHFKTKFKEDNRE